MADGWGLVLLLGGAYLAYKGFKGGKEKAKPVAPSRAAPSPVALGAKAVLPSPPPYSASGGETTAGRYEPRLGRILRPDECTLEELERAFQNAAPRADVYGRTETSNQRYEPALEQNLELGEVSPDELERAFQAAARAPRPRRQVRAK